MCRYVKRLLSSKWRLRTDSCGPRTTDPKFGPKFENLNYDPKTQIKAENWDRGRELDSEDQDPRTELKVPIFGLSFKLLSELTLPDPH